MIKYCLATSLAAAACLLAASAVADVMDYYPARAMNDEQQGVATIDCIVQADGRLADCVIVSESPKGYGFGAATVRMFEDLAHEDMASHKPGDHQKFTFKWRLS